MNDIRKAYADWSTTYDSDDNPTRDLDRRVMRQLAPRTDGVHLLELGCGTGKNTTLLADHAASITALDFSPDMLAEARTKIDADHVTFLEHDLLDSWFAPDGPLDETSFDWVVANLVFEHIEDLAPVFERVASALTPGGHFFFSELHPYKQYAGSGAEFDDPSTGETVELSTFHHDISDFVHAAHTHDLRLAELDEWSDDPPAPRPPRLLTALFTKIEE